MSAARRRVCLSLAALPMLAHADLPAQIDAVKPSVVVVGYFKATNSPRFNLSGTGFAVGDGTLLITNAHVLASGANVDAEARLQVLVRNGDKPLEARNATVLEIDRAHDLALLRMAGAALPPLKLREGSSVREGQSVAIMGFPIGGVLGFSPVTHRGIVSSIAPIALPTANARQLNAANIRSLRDGSFDIFQLDLTAYPGNSGGPLFDADTGEVIGVLNMVFVKSTREAALSQPSGISYAIPATHVLQLLQRNAK